jgi:ATP-dependent DNA ligase
MTLPLKYPFAPMEALSAPRIPPEPGWQYEPKWDGFRCIAFRDGAKIQIQSKAGQSLHRYFPEMSDALALVKAERFVIDGELVIASGLRLSFDDLLMRIHPAESRIRRLAAETPATLIAFDLLVDENGVSLLDRPLQERRRRLERFLKRFAAHVSSLRLSPTTPRIEEARRWFLTMGGSLDGVVAKRQDARYEPGLRTGAMQKIKNLRTADCVVGGFRYGSDSKLVGSLLLGVYDADGRLNHVGFTSSIHAEDRKPMTERLKRLIAPPGFTGNKPGGPSRWSTKRSTEWEPLKPKLVVEVQYDHFSGGRFRHGTKLLRWRPDKAPAQCSINQVHGESASPLGLL